MSLQAHRKQVRTLMVSSRKTSPTWLRALLSVLTPTTGTHSRSFSATAAESKVKLIVSSSSSAWPRRCCRAIRFRSKWCFDSCQTWRQMPFSWFSSLPSLSEVTVQSRNQQCHDGSSVPEATSVKTSELLPASRGNVTSSRRSEATSSTALCQRMRALSK